MGSGNAVGVFFFQTLHFNVKLHENKKKTQWNDKKTNQQKIEKKTKLIK